VTFTLPEELPATVAELDTLLDNARASINVIQARRAAGEDLTRDDVAALRGLLEAVDVLTAARAEVAAADIAHASEVNALLDRAAAATETAAPAEEMPPDEPVPDAEPEPVAEAPPLPADPEPVEPVAEPEQAEPVAAATAPVTFADVGAYTPPDTAAEPGWEMDPSCPGYRPGMGRVGFAELGAAIDSVMPGSRSRNRPNKPSSAVGYAAQVVARLPRECDIVGDSHALVAAIRTATDERRLPGGSLIRSLTAAAADPTAQVGGWCAPSEQLYTFCDVPNAADLVSLPEITINRGGIRWPIEPDLSQIFEDFEWFFTETQLEAIGSGGEAVAQKTCVSIPCPDEFEEIRLSAVGYCVEAGILQTQGWPELITWFMQSLTQEHLRALSRRTILDMVAGSTAKVIDPDTQIGTASSLLNSLALQATNLRLNRGLARNATIEGIAPSWLAEVMRADLAMQEDVALKDVTDGMVLGWFGSRNIALQLVGDWQTRGSGEPGNLGTLAWPASVDVLLYPAGTWFRSMSNVIELGVMYPKEQLQVNRYTRFFTEDALAVGKRCNQSLVVTVPICVSGAVGDRQSVVCAAGS
jgi:hypothetical protein